jgi:hypothetical protein
MDGSFRRMDSHSILDSESSDDKVSISRSELDRLHQEIKELEDSKAFWRDSAHELRKEMTERRAQDNHNLQRLREVTAENAELRRIKQENCPPRRLRPSAPVVKTEPNSGLSIRQTLPQQSRLVPALSPTAAQPKTRSIPPLHQVKHRPLDAESPALSSPSSSFNAISAGMSVDRATAFHNSSTHDHDDIVSVDLAHVDTDSLPGFGRDDSVGGDDSGALKRYVCCVFVEIPYHCPLSSYQYRCTPTGASYHLQALALVLAE